MSPFSSHVGSIETSIFLPELSDAQFTRISQMVYQLTGIDLHSGKEKMVRGRLLKRLHLLGMKNFDQYLHFLQRKSSTHEVIAMIDALTTNLTKFFRESPHFDHLRARVLPMLRDGRSRMRFWSAGCSSGEEPYSLAILLREEMSNIDRRDCRILATDISTRVLAQAHEGIYDGEQLKDVPQELRKKYFTCLQAKPASTFRVNDNVRAMVRFARLNLMNSWPMTGPFDVIFCRNVMIYFDKPTQQLLVQRFWELLKEGGCLFIGHSESLPHSCRKLKYVQPAIYVR